MKRKEDIMYYFTHYPHKGYDEEVAELKIDGDCRKPQRGMLLKAAEVYNINLSESFMIGASDSDIEAGKAAGCKSIMINEGGLLDAVKKILLLIC